LPGIDTYVDNPAGDLRRYGGLTHGFDGRLDRKTDIDVAQLHDDACRGVGCESPARRQQADGQGTKDQLEEEKALGEETGIASYVHEY
jgi:hypothetical protein